MRQGITSLIEVEDSLELVATCENYDQLIEAVAEYLDLPPVWAFEVASIYSMFDDKPTGKHKVNICTNISCWLNSLVF